VREFWCWTPCLVAVVRTTYLRSRAWAFTATMSVYGSTACVVVNSHVVSGSVKHVAYVRITSMPFLAFPGLCSQQPSACSVLVVAAAFLLSMLWSSALGCCSQAPT
jgi:hypothetical protein